MDNTLNNELKKYYSLNTLLVVPKYMQYGGKSYVLPLGILYVSAALKKAGLCVKTINLNHAGEKHEEALSDCIIKNNINIVGVGGLSGEFSDIAPVFSYVKKHFPDIITIAGGGIITSTPVTAMQALEHADIGVIGEGEESVPELIKALERNSSLEEIPGLVIKKNNSFVCTSQRPDIDNLDNLPLPDYEGFNYEAYLHENFAGYGPKGEKLSPVSVIGSRSCPYRCTFCFHPNGESYRTRSIDSIFREIDYLIEHYKVNYIALREELFAKEVGRIKEFCDRIAEYDIYWSVQLRINQVNEEVFSALKKANCLYVFLGIESMDDTVLKSMKKGINSEQVIKALELSKKYDITIRSGLIFGDKAETRDSANKSLEWLKSHQNKQGLNNCSSLTADMIIPFPGSPIYSDAVRRGIISNPIQYLRYGCPIVNLTLLNEAEFIELIKQVQLFNGRTYHYLNADSLRIIKPDSH